MNLEAWLRGRGGGPQGVVVLSEAAQPGPASSEPPQIGQCMFHCPRVYKRGEMGSWQRKFLMVFYGAFTLYGVAIGWLYWSGYFELDVIDG
uniref:Uncharacterized protein n=1 Tax=Anopheles atroparvus TaxID=41427 RepID=A0A182JJ19_ANOAO